ncbi:hypothetical protein PGT21_019071 [Puccinia graminis f. sp. tritici]|uniref:Uncharacterized protein n=1 Tax=Puccinia graminis f. sp. tritici TaxID=56615 RepID=A0A5B0PBN8_PUCGR|nr:hypothetical protein PGT21_019071 [Puccinia graminis f. sp. tritici]KAA1126014.1 hypothetical protein PGTUg99_011682 [Puccinia graminis f. sp. tritici]
MHVAAASSGPSLGVSKPLDLRTWQTVCVATVAWLSIRRPPIVRHPSWQTAMPVTFALVVVASSARIRLAIEPHTLISKTQFGTLQ